MLIALILTVTAEPSLDPINPATWTTYVGPFAAVAALFMWIVFYLVKQHRHCEEVVMVKDAELAALNKMLIELVKTSTEQLTRLSDQNKEVTVTLGMVSSYLHDVQRGAQS